MLRSALFQVLKLYFGKSWPLWMLAGTALIFWPVFVFFPYIDFSPSKFTEHWIKTTIGAFVILLVVEALALSREQREEADVALVFLRDRLIAPLQRIERELRLLSESPPPELGAIHKWAEQIRVTWNLVLEHWSEIPPRHHFRGSLESDLRTAYHSFDHERIDTALARLSSLPSPTVLNKEECQSISAELKAKIVELDAILDVGIASKR